MELQNIYLSTVLVTISRQHKAYLYILTNENHECVHITNLYPARSFVTLSLIKHQNDMAVHMHGHLRFPSDVKKGTLAILK